MFYKPGVCNIGKNEIRKRYAFGVFGFILTGAIFYLFTVYHLSTWWFLTLVVPFGFLIPLILAFEGIFQGYLHFCAGFGAAGLYDFSGTRDEKGRVKNPIQHRKDLRMSTRIHLYSLGAAVTATVILLLIASVWL